MTVLDRPRTSGGHGASLTSELHPTASSTTTATGGSPVPLDWVVNPPALRYSPGSGGMVSPAMVKPDTTGRGSWQQRFEAPAPTKAATNLAIASPADKIAAVRAALSLNIKELAGILRVQRPTVYSWIDGEAEPQTENVRRLNSLFELARSWSGLTEQPLGEDVRRPHFSGGRSFAELLAEGNPNDLSLREKLQELEAAQRGRTAPKQKTLRKILEEKGVAVRRNSETVDMLTGKRISDE